MRIFEVFGKPEMVTRSEIGDNTKICPLPCGLFCAKNTVRIYCTWHHEAALTLNQFHTIQQRSRRYHDAMVLLQGDQATARIVVLAARVIPLWGMTDAEAVEMVER
jgi:hypothetical protein